MAQIFPRRINKLAIYALAGTLLFGATAVGGVWYFFSPEYTDVGYAPVQPVPYSHKLHAYDLGIDCRYCHIGVDLSPKATVPPTQACMNCHSVVKRDSPLLTPLIESFQNDKRMMWVRVHKVPDYAFFDHSAHIAKGVGCVTCHGRIDQMEVVRQVEPLSMSWCLDCHRNPAPNLRPLDEITNMEWAPPDDEAEWLSWQERAMQERNVKPPVDCSGCHR